MAAISSDADPTADSLEQPSRLRRKRSRLLTDQDKISQHKTSKYKASKYKWLLLLPLTLLPVAAIASNRTETAEPTERLQVLPVETTTLAGIDSYTAGRSYTGELVAQRSSELGFERSGTVTAVLADEGDVVPAGAPVARLDVRDLEAQRQQLEAKKRQLLAQLQELESGPRTEDIASAEAAVSNLRNQLELAQLQAQRRAELYAKGAVSREELDERQFGANAIADRLSQAQSQLAELRNGTRQEQVSAQAAQVDGINAELKAIDIALDKSTLFAPFGGEVSVRSVDEGTVVGSGQAVIALVESGAVEARIGVPIDIAQRLEVGSAQSVEVAGRTYGANVSARLPAIDEASQTVTVVLSIVEAESAVIGETARLVVNEQQAESGYWIPSTALIAGDRGLWSVYVLGEPEAAGYRVTRRDVEVLHTEGGNVDGSIVEGGNFEGGIVANGSKRAFIRGLVDSGDRVITSGTHRIVTGQLVSPAGE